MDAPRREWPADQLRAGDASRREWPADQLRAGDADRQAVVSELQQHYVQGRLTSDELGERVAQALRARTFGELQVPLQDLPPDSPWPHPDPPGIPQRAPRRGWQANLLAPPFGPALILIGLLILLWLFALPTFHVGVVPIWPAVILGFFFVGRPGGGRPGR